jgi:hypothetical protein
LLLLLLLQGMAIPMHIGNGRRLTGKDSLIHKHKMMKGMKGASVGYIGAASYGMVGARNLCTHAI